jgi:hypothetical protein
MLRRLNRIEILRRTQRIGLGELLCRIFVVRKPVGAFEIFRCVEALLECLKSEFRQSRLYGAYSLRKFTEFSITQMVRS